MTMRITVGPHAGRNAAGSWLLEADESTTLQEASQALGVPSEGLDPQGSPDDPLGSSTVLSGAVVLSDTTSSRPAPGTVRLAIVGGPFSGETIYIPGAADFTIGSAGANITLADPGLSPVHVRIVIDEDATGGRAALRARVIPADSGSVVCVNGEEVEGEGVLVPADVLQLGASILRLGIVPAADADLHRDPEGGRGFNRPARLRAGAEQPVLLLPGDKPEDPDQSPMPWLSAIIPVVLGVTMAILFGRAVMLLMAAASPIMVIGSFLTNRRLAKKKGLKTEQQWFEEVRTASKRLGELVRKQRLDSWFDHPDPVVIEDIATSPMSRLWERRRGDADALAMRIGCTEMDLDVRFEGGGKDRGIERRVGVSPCPLSVDLRRGPLGIAGDRGAATALARALTVSFATLRSPRDAWIVVICPDDAANQWQFVQWLPHAQTSDTGAVAIGNTNDTRRERLRELVVMMEFRARSAGHRSAPPLDDVLVIIDGARDYRMLPGMVPLLENGAEVGIHIVAIDTERARLPEEAASVVLIDPTDFSTARVETGGKYFPIVLLDGMSTTRADTIARSLCSLRHVSGVGDDSVLPSTVRLVDLLGIDLDDTEPLLKRWTTQPRNTYVVVGATGEGEFALDISRDGPHALVAGTTGSGKSEFLQTLVVSLAMANRPDALNFVLVDYKGGTAFADCERLPHTVGMVTNLDARETERALASLEAELKRRERVLRDMAAKDVDAAWAKDADTAAARGLARLMIVIDEFAELKTELPEFIDGLVRIARVGRSLGVNLVLATQRPAGVVTPEMQSNINLRVALRVTDRSDSSDILGSVEAALILPSTPGRAFVRLGPSAAPMPFQSARVAGLRPGGQRSTRSEPRKARLTWDTLGFPPQFPAIRGDGPEHTDHDDTDLRALVALIGHAAQELGVVRNPSPWLLPLPALLTLDRFEGEEIPEHRIVLGLKDLPEEQDQKPLLWDLRSASHVLFIGGSMSGRTSALRAMAAQLIQQFTPADLHLYVIDFGNGALLPLVDAPHTGAVVTQLDADRLPRLVSALLEDLARRQAVLAAAGVGHISEQRKNAELADRLPYAAVVLDGWERMLSTLNPDQLVTFREQFMRLLREGPAVGLRVLITGDRGVSGDKMSAFIDEQYVLPMRDVSDYRTAGILVRDIPTNLPPGRVLFGADGIEAQLVLLARDGSGEAQTTALRRTVELVSNHYEQYPALDTLPTPLRVDPLPRYVSMSDALALPVGDPHAANGPVIAVGGDHLARYGVDWPGAGGLLVTGPRRSGRSTALATFLHQLTVTPEEPVVVVSVRESILTATARARGIPVVSDAALTPPELDAVLGDAAVRATIIVDDAEQFKNAPIEHTLVGAKPRAVYAVSADSESLTSLFGGPIVEAKRSRQALVLRPESSILGTQAIGSSIPKFLLGRATPGHGVWATPSGWMSVRVPDLAGG